MNSDPVPVTGLILAGGRGSRLGGIDKGWLPFEGAALIELAIAALRPQVREIVISANRHIGRYRDLGCAVVEDDAEHAGAGPLAGILAGFRVAPSELVLCIPCDTPRLPGDLFARLHRALGAGQAAVVRSGSGVEPLHFLARRALADDLSAWLQTGQRSCMEWWRGRTVNYAAWPGAASLSFNINTPDDSTRRA